MRKLLPVCIIVLLIACVAGKAIAKELKIGFVDRRTIFFDYKKIKEITKELEKDQQDARLEMETKANEIRKLQDEMELLSESAKAEKEPILKEKAKEFDNFRREKMQEIGRKRDDNMRKINEHIETVCEQYGKNKGFDVVIDKGATIYAPDAADITDEVLAELNKE